jgi:hypothetical protein
MTSGSALRAPVWGPSASGFSVKVAPCALLFSPSPWEMAGVRDTTMATAPYIPLGGVGAMVVSRGAPG